VSRALVVEDSDEFADDLLQTFADYGIDAERAQDGETALSMLQASSFDGVVLDLKLSKNPEERQGLGVLEWIRKEKPMIAVVVVSAQPHLCNRAVEVGVDAILNKPVEAAHVFQYLDRAMERRRLREENGKLRRLLKLSLTASTASALPFVCAMVFLLIWEALFPQNNAGLFVALTIAVLALVGAKRISNFALDFFRIRLNIKLAPDISRKAPKEDGGQ
jgi:CheY-like chemotaxis protein